ncbi:MAG: hypothetical protein K9M81_04705 [Chthoniobacterales bacterium]|nr:hypothetical protein [Chthoniobacterales bacterium]
MFSSHTFISLTLGLLLFFSHLIALLIPGYSKRFLQHFPRSSRLGGLLFYVSGIWACILVVTIDLGEFSPMRYFILLGILVCIVLFRWLVPNFLAVRSLGFLALLAAHPILEINFLRSGLNTILLSLLAYIWIISGLFFVGMPYLLRNTINLITSQKNQLLWNILCWLGILYGSVLMVGGILSFNPHISY